MAIASRFKKKYSNLDHAFTQITTPGYLHDTPHNVIAITMIIANELVLLSLYCSHADSNGLNFPPFAFPAHLDFSNGCQESCCCRRAQEGCCPEEGRCGQGEGCAQGEEGGGPEEGHTEEGDPEEGIRLDKNSKLPYITHHVTFHQEAAPAVVAPVVVAAPAAAAAPGNF
jgi:hypothetical protein